MERLLLFIFNFIIIIGTSTANYHGPFLLWGPDRLNEENQPLLREFNHKTLTLMYSEAKAIILFVRNGTSKLDKENFPNFREFISKTKWTYLPQQNLPAEPMDYNSNVEVITLVGPASQQDVELGALFRDAVSIYGEGKVLGILSNQVEEQHFIYKRETPNEDDEDKKEKTGKKKSKSKTENKKKKEEESEEVEPQPEEEEDKDNFIYLADKKGLLYTNEAPILNLTVENKIKSFVLKTHGTVTHDFNTKRASLDINFKTDEGKVTLRFRFPIQEGTWTLSSVQVEFVDLPNIVLYLSGGPKPSAPLEFSYKCAQGDLVFRNGSDVLVIKDYQVQPVLGGVNKFGDAYDCVGFMSAPIWSGIFVSTLIIFVSFIGILAIMDIKKPNFENSRSKQLTFTIQE